MDQLFNGEGTTLLSEGVLLDISSVIFFVFLFLQLSPLVAPFPRSNWKYPL